MLGLLGQFGRQVRGPWGRRGWGKSSYYGSPAGQQDTQRKIAKKKRKIEELRRELQNLERRAAFFLRRSAPGGGAAGHLHHHLPPWAGPGPDPRRGRATPVSRPPPPPAPKPPVPVLRPTAPPVPKAPPKPVGLTESQKDARYLARYADIAKAVRGGTYRTGRQHWNRHGKREGRTFDGLRPGFLAGFGGWWNK